MIRCFPSMSIQNFGERIIPPVVVDNRRLSAKGLF